MNLLVVVSTLIVPINAAATNRNSDGICFQGQYYDKVLLQTGLDRPFLLAMDYETDTLYFSYNIADNEYKSARLNLRTNEIKEIDGIPNGFSHAVDSEHNLLFVGTKDGIYVYNLNTDQSEFYGAKGQFIWTLFFKYDMLYYSEYPHQDFYTFSNGEPKKFKDLEHTKARYFIIDDDDDMFFNNRTGLYKQAKGTTDAVLYKTSQNLDISALTTDSYGNIYVGAFDGVYKVSKHEDKIENVLPIRGIFGLTFDGDDNIIYSDGSRVVRLKDSKEKSC